MGKFFILGLPRSRTAWLSHYLTDEDGVCYHEALHDYPDYSEFMRTDYAGDSTTCYPVIKDFVKGKVIVIERDVEEVIHSLEMAFGQGFNVQVPSWKDELDSIKDCLRIKYDDINSRLKDIWEYIKPSQFSQERAEEYIMRHIENTLVMEDARSWHG